MGDPQGKVISGKLFQVPLQDAGDLLKEDQLRTESREIMLLETCTSYRV